MTFEEALTHLGGKLNAPPRYVRERVWDEMPHYIWIVAGDRRNRTVYCEWCGRPREERKTGSCWSYTYRQGAKITCPYCGGDVTVKHYGRGWSNIYDRLQVVWYQKSAVDSNAVVAVGAHCCRDFSESEGRPWAEGPDIDVRSFAVIVPGEGAYRFKQDVIRWALRGGDRAIWRPDAIRWIPVKREGNLTFGATGGYPFVRANPLRTAVLDDTLEEAIRDATLARAWCGEYLTDQSPDGVKALNLIAKYPCVEYMTKLGMREIVRDRIDGELPAGLINWRGRNMAAVLKLDRGRLGEIKHAGVGITPALLMLYRWLDENGLRLTAAAAHNVAVLCDRWGSREAIPKQMTMLLSLFDRPRWRRALKYVARQAEKYNDTRLHLGDFRDYWRACVRLGENLEDDATAFPSDIREAEARLNARIQRERDNANRETREMQDKLIAKRYKGLLRDYGFSFGGLSLRPAKTAEEVWREGELLHHCVGSYVNRYAEGDTVICVLRRDVDPDQPWRTVEISAKTGKLVQDRGYRNDTSMGTPLTEKYKAMLDLFWEAWSERKRPA